MQRLQRNLRRALDANEHRAAGPGIDVAGKSGTDERVALERTRHPAHAVKLPEPIVDAIDADLAGPASAFLPGDKALRDDQRSHAAEC